MYNIVDRTLSNNFFKHESLYYLLSLLSNVSSHLSSFLECLRLLIPQATEALVATEPRILLVVH